MKKVFLVLALTSVQFAAEVSAQFARANGGAELVFIPVSGLTGKEIKSKLEQYQKDGKTQVIVLGDIRFSKLDLQAYNEGKTLIEVILENQKDLPAGRASEILSLSNMMNNPYFGKMETLGAALSANQGEKNPEMEQKVLKNAAADAIANDQKLKPFMTKWASSDKLKLKNLSADAGLFKDYVTVAMIEAPSAETKSVSLRAVFAGVREMSEKQKSLKPSIMFVKNEDSIEIVYSKHALPLVPGILDHMVSEGFALSKKSTFTGEMKRIVMNAPANTQLTTEKLWKYTQRSLESIESTVRENELVS